MTIAFQYKNKTVIVDTIIVNHLTQDLLLGYDFWLAAGFQIIDANAEEGLAVLPPSISQIPTEVQLQERDRIALVRAVNKFLITTITFLGKTHLIKHRIELIAGAEPYMQRTYGYAPALQKMINDEIDVMLARGVIIPSQSPVALPCVAVKKHGKIRLCLDRIVDVSTK